jgi:uncharacterized protein YbjT (DUF2867 family)
MILVVGASGELGSRVVRELCARGEPVRCLVRPQTDDTRLRAVGAEIASGDLTDPVSLGKACGGADVVIATATAIARRLGGASGPDLREVDEIGMAALVSAAQDADVTRFIYLSYAGVDAGLGFPLERAKLANEAGLRASSMRVTVVRPDAFQEIHLAPMGRFDMKAGKVAVFGKGDMKHRWVSTDDVAKLVARVALEADAPNLIEFGGPEAISRNDAIAVAQEATGRTMKVQRMPLFAARLAMRLMRNRNQALASVFGTGVLMDTVASDWDDAPLRDRGIQPRSATDFIQAQARSLSGG